MEAGDSCAYEEWPVLDSDLITLFFADDPPFLVDLVMRHASSIRFRFCGSWFKIVDRKREYLILAACPLGTGWRRTGS
jgi:hypothetical protein